MASCPLPQLRRRSLEDLRATANNRLVELTDAARVYAHWALQLVCAQLRAAMPTAATIRVEILGRRPRCRLVEICELAGEVVWSRDNAARTAHPIAGIEALLTELLRWRSPDQLPGWSPTSAARGVYLVDLQAVPPAVTLDLDGVAARDDAPNLGSVVAAFAELFNSWMPPITQAVGEYARGLVEGYFPPLTDITRWATVPTALGHPVPTSDTVHQLANDPLDDEDWVIGIGSVHGLAAGVLESFDTGESFGHEDPLHVRVGLHSQELAARALTVAQLADLFQGDVRLTAAVILQAIDQTARR